jgi:RIO kinase 1
MSSDFFLHEKWIKKLDRQTQEVINRVGVDRKTLDEVFDKSTLLLLGKLISDKVIDYLDFPISTGKEAIIFRGVTSKKGFVALKIYRTSTLTFKHISKYIEGDPRFQIANKSKREIIYEWTIKEFKNLERLKKAKVRAPRPIKRAKNVLVMEYIGDAEKPAPLLRDVEVNDPEKICDTILNYIALMYSKAEIVHADLSAFNVLIYKGKPYLIDLGQGVILEHPLSHEFLKRDIHNIVQYFGKFGIKKDEEKILEKIVKKHE